MLCDWCVLVTYILGEREHQKRYDEKSLSLCVARRLGTNHQSPRLVVAPLRVCVSVKASSERRRKRRGKNSRRKRAVFQREDGVERRRDGTGPQTIKRRHVVGIAERRRRGEERVENETVLVWVCVCARRRWDYFFADGVFDWKAVSGVFVDP